MTELADFKNGELESDVEKSLTAERKSTRETNEFKARRLCYTRQHGTREEADWVRDARSYAEEKRI